MIYIVGCYHRHQWFGIKESKHPVDLTAFIESFLEDHNIDLIAEEFNEECIDFTVKKVVCVEIADKHEIEHLYIEPTYDEREANDMLGEDALLKAREENNWSDEKFEKQTNIDHGKRERYWLDVIEEDHDSDSEILVICGNKHVDSFGNLLEEERYETDNIANFDLS